jgi:hypothetical protein
MINLEKGKQDKLNDVKLYDECLKTNSEEYIFVCYTGMGFA